MAIPHVTPANEHYTYCNQDCDEQQAILCDMEKNPRDYLAHVDGMVRSHADWAMEHYGIRWFRCIGTDRKQASIELGNLHKRLRELAAGCLPGHCYAQQGA